MLWSGKTIWPKTQGSGYESLECALDSFIQEMVDIDSMQVGFVPGCGTTDAIFISHHEGMQLNL